MADLSTTAKAKSEKALLEQFCIIHDLDWDQTTWTLEQRLAFKQRMRAHSAKWKDMRAEAAAATN